MCFKISNITSSLIAAVLILCGLTIANAQRPSVMTIPSDIYMNKNKFVDNVTTIDGSTKVVPNYTKLFLEDRYMRIIMTAINSAFQDNQYPIKDFESTLKRLNNREIEMSVSERPSQVSMRDMILSDARSDIVLDIDYFIEKTIKGESIVFTINAIDAYTSEPLASIPLSGVPGAGVQLSVLLKEAVVQSMPEFEAKLLNHFVDIRDNGRKGIVEVTLAQSCNFDLEEWFNYGGQEEELSFILRDIVKKNTVNSQFRVKTSTRTQMLFEDVRIPLVDDDNYPQDFETWANNKIVRPLRREPGIIIKRETIGLGHVRLIVESAR
jgi:hypothetical protein